VSPIHFAYTRVYNNIINFPLLILTSDNLALGTKKFLSEAYLMNGVMQRPVVFATGGGGRYTRLWSLVWSRSAVEVHRCAA
jgi:hypothetical protein